MKEKDRFVWMLLHPEGERWREMTKRMVTGMLVLQQESFKLNGARRGGTALRELPLGHLSPGSITDTSKVALHL